MPKCQLEEIHSRDANLQYSGEKIIYTVIYAYAKYRGISSLLLVITRKKSNLLRGSPIVFISGVSDASSSSSLDHYAVLCYLIKC